MTFKYFDKPEIHTGLLETKITCDICGQEKICFDAEAFYGNDTINSICPDCLSSGQLVDRDIFTCDGDIKELIRQLKDLNPLLTETEVNELATLKTTELEKKTPKLVTWQDWSWPCADGDYCKFIGYGSKPFYNSLATNTTGKDIFSNSLYYNLKDDSDVDYLWDDFMPETEVTDYNESNELSTLFYVFRSLNSEKIITIWDCN